MMEYVFDEYDIREIQPLNKRFEKIKEWFSNANNDESIRWSCVYLTGEIWEDVTKEFKAMIADFMTWILKYDNNGVVKHEAAFQIGLRNMRDKIPDLVDAIRNDPDVLVKHEAIEALGLMRDHGSKTLLEELSQDKDLSVNQTAKFVLKQLERLKGKGNFRDGEPI